MNIRFGLTAALGALALALPGSGHAIALCPEGCPPPGPVPAAVSEFASFQITNSGIYSAGAYAAGLSGALSVGPSGAVPTVTTNASGQTVITAGPASGTEVALKSDLMPVAAIFAAATRSDSGGAVGNFLPVVESVTRLKYRVTIHAVDLTHAAILSGSLDAPLAQVTAHYRLTSSGTSQSFASIRTGIENATFQDGDLASCINGAGACGSGSFKLSLYFADSTGFANGDPLDFHSLIALEANALGGAFSLASGQGRGTAFIDPVVTLAAGLDPTFYSLVIADGLVSNLAEPPTAVPEPATWALMLSGVWAGALLRQRRINKARPD